MARPDTAPLPWRVALRRWLRLRPSSGERRLRAAIAEYRSELGRLNGGSPWVMRAAQQLDQADMALQRGDLETGWACHQAARRAEILGYTRAEIETASAVLYHEASSDKVGGWRAKAIIALLRDVEKRDVRVDTALARIAEDGDLVTELASQLADGKDVGAVRTAVAGLLSARGASAKVAEQAASVLVEVGGRPPSGGRLRAALASFGEAGAGERTALYHATLIRDEGFQNQYRRIDKLRQHLAVLSATLVLSLLGIVIMTLAVPIDLEDQEPFGGRILGYVALFGALGGSLSAIRSVTRGATRSRIPEQIWQGAIVYVRPLFGAAAAVGVYAFMRSGIIQVQTNNDAAVLAVSFVAGFTERLVTSAVGAVAQREEQQPSA